MTGCLRGRGEMRISICGFVFEKEGRRCDFKKALEALVIRRSHEKNSSLLHAPRAASPIAIMEINTFALKDEGSEPILELSISIRYTGTLSHAEKGKSSNSS